MYFHRYPEWKQNLPRSVKLCVFNNLLLAVTSRLPDTLNNATMTQVNSSLWCFSSPALHWFCKSRPLSSRSDRYGHRPEKHPSSYSVSPSFSSSSTPSPPHSKHRSGPRAYRSHGAPYSPHQPRHHHTTGRPHAEEEPLQCCNFLLSIIHLESG